jgi:hypothetical protein
MATMFDYPINEKRKFMKKNKYYHVILVLVLSSLSCVTFARKSLVCQHFVEYDTIVKQMDHCDCRQYVPGDKQSIMDLGLGTIQFTVNIQGCLNNKTGVQCVNNALSSDGCSWQS